MFTIFKSYNVRSYSHHQLKNECQVQLLTDEKNDSVIFCFILGEWL